MNDRGEYIEFDGRPAVRFERTYPYPVERLWRAITEPEELARWFPSHVTIDVRPGGTVEFSGDPNAAPTTGTVLVADAPHRLVYTWGGDELHFELTSTPDGTTLVFVDILEERDTAARTATGWTVCLTAFDSALAGEPVDGPHSAGAMRRGRLVYEAYLAAGMPSGAAVPED